MKAKTIYQIHALIGRCHLHTKKKNTYSITLKMGAKNVASTEYKLPYNDQINFNTQLILKIDKALFDGPGKLSMAVSMLTEQKQRKIIGTVFVNYKQKGLQTITVSQCSCKDKGFDVNVEFEVVNIQNLNNNQNNNKIQSPNHSQMKDLKKALTVSRQKQLVKSSRVKQTIATKSPIQKTQSKINKPKIEKQQKNQLSSNLSSLTTKIVPNSSRLNQQTKQYVNQLKDKIQELELKLKDYTSKERTHRKQVSSLQNQINILKNENDCLIQLLKFQQEKSSAALKYIQFLTDKIGQKALLDSNLNLYLQMIENIKLDEKTDTSLAIIQHKKSYKNLEDYSFQFKPIYEKQQINEQSNERLIGQLQFYKTTIQEMKHKIKQLQVQQAQKSQNLNYLQIQIQKINKQNQHIKFQLDQSQKSQNKYHAQIKILKVSNQNLQQQIKQLQKNIKQHKNHEQIFKNQKNQIEKKLNTLNSQNKTLQQKIHDLEKKIEKLKNIQKKYEELMKMVEDKQKIKSKQNKKQKKPQNLLTINPPKTPLQSEICPNKSRFQQGDTGLIENIIQQINGCIDNNKPQELLLSSRRVQSSSDHFLARNKSESLLKDLEIDPQSEDPNTNQTSKDIYRATYTNSDSSSKNIKKTAIPQHEKQVQRYNYDYDIDSLNYFNNFEQDHDGISQVTANEENCQVQVDMMNKR